MCQTKDKATSMRIRGGENCLASQDGFHDIILLSPQPISNFTATLLTCSCHIVCTLDFRSQQTVGQLALPFWMAEATGVHGRMTLLALLLFCETYRADILNFEIHYPVPGYDT
jgi:hypothetical protein